MGAWNVEDADQHVRIHYRPVASALGRGGQRHLQTRVNAQTTGVGLLQAAPGGKAFGSLQPSAATLPTRTRPAG